MSLDTPPDIDDDPLRVEIVRTKTDGEIWVTAAGLWLLSAPLHALIVWWLLHYLPVPDLNYWQALAAVVVVRVFCSTIGRPVTAWTRERK